MLQFLREFLIADQESDWILEQVLQGNPSVLAGFGLYTHGILPYIFLVKFNNPNMRIKLINVQLMF